MPIIAGQAWTDASGDPFTDASGDPIYEPDLPVRITNGVLMQAGSGGGGIDPFGIIEFLQDLLDGALEMQAIRNLQDDINAFMNQASASVFDSHDPLHQSQVNLSANGIIDSIGMPTVQIEWPTEAPTWYTAPTPVDLENVGQYVWAYDLTMPTLNSGNVAYPAQTVMVNLWTHALIRAGFEGIPLAGNPYWSLVALDPEAYLTNYGNWNSPSTFQMVPLVDVGTIQADDTVMSWLTREYPGFTYYNNFPAGTESGNGVWIIPDSPDPTYGFRFRLTDADLSTQVITTITNNTTTATLNLPLWPGLADVTLGDSVPLSNGLVIDGPLDGLIITITTHPTGAGKYVFGSVTSWTHAGAVIFYNDRGDYERAESFGLDTQLLVPKTMVHAAGAIVRLTQGWSGTVRKWSRAV